MVRVSTIEIPDEQPARRIAIEQLLREVVPSFADCPEADFDHRVLSGGATNELFRVSRKSASEAAAAVVRVYGKNTDKIIERDGEVFWQGLFLHTFGRCKNGLVYEFLSGHHPLQPYDLPPEAEKIAKHLGEFHVQAAHRSLYALPYATMSNHILHTLDDWVKTAYAEDTWKLLESKYGASHRQALLVYKTGVTEAIAETVAVLRSASHLMPEVPCHNDLLGLNIMKCDATGKVRFIDFEYMRRNYCYFDVANHFNEYCGMDCNWANYPTLEQQRVFLRAYLASVKSAAGDDDASAVSDAAVESARRLTNLLSVASNLKWGVWSLVQAAHSVIDFDFVSYGAKRLRRAIDTLPGFGGEVKALISA